MYTYSLQLTPTLHPLRIPISFVDCNLNNNSIPLLQMQFKQFPVYHGKNVGMLGFFFNFKIE